MDWDTWTDSAGSTGAHFGAMDMSYKPPKLGDLAPSYGAYLGAQAGAVAHDTSLLSQGVTIGRLAYAKYGTDEPKISAADAKNQTTSAGFPELDFGTGSTTQSAIDITLSRAKDRAQRDEIKAAYKPSLAGDIAHQAVLGLADPVNLGMSLIPYYGQAQLAAKIAAGTSIAERLAYGTVAGAAAGTTFMAAAQPITATAMAMEGRDYTIADAMRDTILGGAFGAGLHVVGGSVRELKNYVFPSKVKPRDGEMNKPRISGVPEPIADETNPAVLPPEEPRLSRIERMDRDTFFHAWVSGEVPLDTSDPRNFTYLTHTKEGSYVPFAKREMPQGIRQAAGVSGEGHSEVLSDIDLGLANGIPENDLVAHLVHMHAMQHEPAYNDAVDAWLREFDLRRQWDGDWTKANADIGPLLTDELSKIDFENPQRPLKERPSLESVHSAHEEMRQHSSAHALLMLRKVDLAERSRLNTPPENPVEVHDRLPADVKNHALAAAISDVASGHPVRAAEVVKLLVKDDPALRDSVDMLRNLRQGGPKFEDTDARTAWWAERLAEKAPDTRASKGVTGVLRKAGGIRDTAGTIRLKTGNEVKAPVGTLITQRGTKTTKRGLEIGPALEKLKEAGYDLTEDELHDALKREWAGDSWTLPSDMAQRQLDFEARAAHNEEMLRAAKIPKGAKRSVKAERLASFERDLARQEQVRVIDAAHVLEERMREMVKPDSEPKPKPVDTSEITRQIATDKAPAHILAERTAEIEELVKEAHEQLKTFEDPETLAELEASLREIASENKDWENVVKAATGCLYQPDAYKSEELAGIKRATKAKPAKAASAESEAKPVSTTPRIADHPRLTEQRVPPKQPVERAPEAYGKPGDMPREDVVDQLPKLPGGGVDEESVSRRLSARWGVDSWEELPRSLQNAVKRWGMPEDPEKPGLSTQALEASKPKDDKLLEAKQQQYTSGPRTPMAEAIRRRDREVAQLEKTVMGRTELRRKIAEADARFHEETLAHSLGQQFNPNKLERPDEIPLAPSRREALYKTITTTNSADALKPVLDAARLKQGSDFSPDERMYLDRLNRYLFRPAADGEPANSQVAAYLRMTDGKLNKPVDIEQFHQAYVERASETIVNRNGQVTKELVKGTRDAEGNIKGNKFVQKDLHSFKRHLHLYGTREHENFGNETPDEPAVWLIKGDKVRLSPYIPGIEAARGHPE